MSAPLELRDGETWRFRVFTGETESDPHAVAFWDVTITTAGLELAYAEVPKGEEERAAVSWAELHLILGNRFALYEDRDETRQAIAEATEELIAARVERHRIATHSLALMRQLGILQERATKAGPRTLRERALARGILLEQ